MVSSALGAAFRIVVLTCSRIFRASFGKPAIPQKMLFAFFEIMG